MIHAKASKNWLVTRSDAASSTCVFSYVVPIAELKYHTYVAAMSEPVPSPEMGKGNQAFSGSCLLCAFKFPRAPSTSSIELSVASGRAIIFCFGAKITSNDDLRLPFPKFGQRSYIWGGA